MISDHTLQWVDFCIKKLFNENIGPHVSPFDRQFTLRNPKKKHEFQKKLHELNDKDRVEDKVKALAKDFKRIGDRGLTDPEVIALVLRYQALDKIIHDNMIAAANSIGRKNYGYQLSPDLKASGEDITFWKGVCSCIRRKAPFTARVTKMADARKMNEAEYTLTYKAARRKLSEARKRRREIINNEGEERAKWLEELAIAMNVDDPLKSHEDCIKQMANAARQRQMQRKMSNAMKPLRGSLDYILVPRERWFHSKSTDEIYEFDEGLFRARQRAENDLKYHQFSSLKTPPNDIKTIEVNPSGNNIIRLTTRPTDDPHWDRVSDPKEIEQWLAR
ncbi:hypothetical protein ACHAWF_012949 [Thalassiosira exigua]